MKLEYSSTKLEKQCATDRSRQRAFGPDRASRLRKRLSSLVAASNLEELRNMPGRLHELTGDRAGQFSMDLDHPYRLILEPVIDPDARNDHAEGFVWSKLTHVRVLSIEDTHA